MTLALAQLGILYDRRYHHKSREVDTRSPSGPGTFVRRESAPFSIQQINRLCRGLDIGDEKVTWVEIEDATHVILALPWHETEKEEAYRALRKWADTIF